MSDSVKHQIQQLLACKLEPSYLLVEDDSHKHKHHLEAMRHPDKGHYHVTIQSHLFVEKTKIDQHRMIYHAIKPCMQGIHALQITIVPT